MKEQLISFETAKLAKEKGFYESTLMAWVEVTNKKSKLFGEKRCRQVNASQLFDNEYYAPTQSLLQKWLREEHEIHININTFYFEDLEKYGYEVEDIIHKNGWVVMSNTAGTYEEALEKGLQEALKLI